MKSAHMYLLIESNKSLYSNEYTKHICIFPVEKDAYKFAISLIKSRIDYYLDPNNINYEINSIVINSIKEKLNETMNLASKKLFKKALRNYNSFYNELFPDYYEIIEVSYKEDFDINISENYIHKQRVFK